jgi:hypothetical protein
MPSPATSVDDCSITSTASQFLTSLLYRNRQLYCRIKEDEARQLAMDFHNRQIYCRAQEDDLLKIAQSLGKQAKAPDIPTSPGPSIPPIVTARVQSLLPLAFAAKPTTKFRRRHLRFNAQQKKAAISRRVDELTLLQQGKKQPPTVVIHDVDIIDNYKGGIGSVRSLPVEPHSPAQARTHLKKAPPPLRSKSRHNPTIA